jgi:hypothetical protein
MDKQNQVPKLVCPRCGSDWVCRSWRSGVFERHLLRVFHYSPYCCDCCNVRFSGTDRAIGISGGVRRNSFRPATSEAGDDPIRPFDKRRWPILGQPSIFARFMNSPVSSLEERGLNRIFRIAKVAETNSYKAKSLLRIQRHAIPQ